MQFNQVDPGRLVLRDGDATLGEYVFEPPEPQLESPRPYLLLHTRDGVEVTGHRPDDHVWHKGLSLALPSVGTHNFWGGPTYLRDQGYVQLANNGTQVHRGFTASGTPIGGALARTARLGERLDWITEQGEILLAEDRTLTARALADASYAVTWHSRLTNVSTDAVAFGSPTTKGRANAGYAGIFWRGPSAFTGGTIVGPDGELGDAARGTPGPWLAYISPDDSAGVLMLGAGPGESPWFARSEEFAGLNPAPFFYDETVLAPGASIELAAVVIVGGADVASLAEQVGAALVAEVRSETAAAQPAKEPTAEPATEATP